MNRRRRQLFDLAKLRGRFRKTHACSAFRVRRSRRRRWRRDQRRVRLSRSEMPWLRHASDRCPRACRRNGTQIDTAIAFHMVKIQSEGPIFGVAHPTRVRRGKSDAASLRHCLNSTTHVHPDNDHEGNSPEHGIDLKISVDAPRQLPTRLRAGLSTKGIAASSDTYEVGRAVHMRATATIYLPIKYCGREQWSEECP